MSAAEEWGHLSPAELERLYGDRTGSVEFYREELRHTKNRRSLDCNCTIPPRMEYRYSVQKVWGVAQLIQVRVCEFHGRWGGDAA